jgi:hypothetical protein
MPHTDARLRLPIFHSRWLLFLVGLTCLMPASCGTKGQKPVFPVQGEVFVQSQPADGALIIFRPAGGEPNLDEWTHGFPRGTVGPDGTYRMSTYGNQDGAPAGEYIVQIRWDAPPTATEDEPSEEEQPPPDRLGGRYMNPSSSTLRATVETKPNVIPRFDLK